MKRQAYDLLECLTSTKDEDSPEYNYIKDARRDAVLKENDYSDLKMELKRRGLSASGDKQEMMIRLLLHVVDPTINFSELTGREANLRFVDEADIRTKKVVEVPKGERRVSSIDDGPDAEDMMLYKRPLVGAGAGAGKDSPQSQRRIVMDGLTRQEVQFRPLRVRQPQARADSPLEPLGAYVVGGRDVLRTWERNAVVVVLVPDERGWRSRAMRVLADEMAFLMQAIVLVPEVRAAEGEAAAVFDDVVSAMDFSRYQYNCRSLCLAGVGSGANAALRCASELTDIGYLLAEKDASFYSFNGSSLAPDRLVPDPRIVELARLGGADDFDDEGPPDEVMEAGTGLLVPADGIGKDSVGGAAAELAAEEEQWMAALRELGEKYDEEERQAFEGNQRGAGNGGETAAASETEASEGDPQGGMDDATILAAISQAEVGQREREAEIAAAHRVRRAQALQTKTEATQRAAELVREANKRSAVRAFRGRFVSEAGALTPKELVQILPKAVLALCPDPAALESLGETLRIPACLVLGAEGEAAGARLQAALSARPDEIIDFSIRVYGTLDRRAARRFAAEDNDLDGSGGSADPVPEAEVKARQDAVAVGAFWLDVYSRAAKEDRTLGIGLNKYSPDALVRISAADLQSVPLRPLPITPELHDDPIALFRNNQIETVKDASQEGSDLSDSIIQRGQTIFE